MMRSVELKYLIILNVLANLKVSYYVNNINILCKI